MDEEDLLLPLRDRRLVSAYPARGIKHTRIPRDWRPAHRSLGLTNSLAGHEKVRMQRRQGGGHCT